MIMSSSAPVGTGTIIAGCCPPPVGCATTIGRIATSSDARDAFRWIGSTFSEQILQVGESLTSGDRTIPAVMAKRFDAQNATLRQLLSGYGYGREKLRNEKMFGQQSRSYTGRIGAWNNSDFLIGQQAVSTFDNRLREQVKGHAEGFESRKQVEVRLRDMPDTHIDPQSVFPPGGTLPKNQAEKLVASLETIVDAFPATEIPEGYRGGMTAAEIRTFRHIERFRAQMAEAVLSEIMSGYMPTIPANEGVTELWRAAGGDGEPAQVRDGHISPVGYFGLLVESRFSSDDYRTGEGGIHAMTPTGLLRELASVSALQMAITQRQLRRSQQMAFLSALQVSGKVAGESLDLNQTLQTVLGD